MTDRDRNAPRREFGNNSAQDIPALRRAAQHLCQGMPVRLRLLQGQHDPPPALLIVNNLAGAASFSQTNKFRAVFRMKYHCLTRLFQKCIAILMC